MKTRSEWWKSFYREETHHCAVQHPTHRCTAT